MLVAKKIDARRLVVYIIIILVMFGGTIFFIYKSYSIDVKTIELTNQEEAVEFSEAGAPFFYQTDEEIDNKDIDGTLDINILESPKFRNLKDNAIEQSLKLEKVGNNPFEKK